MVSMPRSTPWSNVSSNNGSAYEHVSQDEEMATTGIDTMKQLPPPPPQQQQSRRILPDFSWATIILLLFNVAFLTTVWAYRPGQRDLTIADRVFPAAEYEVVRFDKSHNAPDAETDEVWDAAMPPGGGFVVIDNPAYYGLRKGLPYKDGHNKYGMSWAHQYHCLWMLRKEWWKLIGNESELVGMNVTDESPAGKKLHHMAHCFGFLRDGILCNMDMTLEYPTTGEDDVINGYLIPHQCKKRAPYDDFVNKHAPED